MRCRSRFESRRCRPSCRHRRRRASAHWSTPMTAAAAGSRGAWAAGRVLQGHRIVALAQDTGRPQAGQDQPVVETPHAVDRALAGELLSALAVQSEYRHVLGDRVLEADLVQVALLAADDDGCAGDVLEPAVLRPELVVIVRVDIDADRNITERVANEGQARLVLADGRFALAFEQRIDECELPGRRRLVGEDAVTSTVELQVLRVVSDLGERGQARAGVEVHVAQVRMLRRMKADADGRRVAVADLEIDIAHRGVKGSRIRVRDRVIRRHAAHGRKRNAEAAAASAGEAARPCTGEHHHDSDAFLEARRIGREHEYGPRRAEPENAHAWPDVDSPGQPVATGGYEEDAFADVVFGLVDGRLNGSAVVGLSIAFRAELRGGKVDGLGVFQARGDYRCGGDAAGQQRGEQRISEECVHWTNRGIARGVNGWKLGVQRGARGGAETGAETQVASFARWRQAAYGRVVQASRARRADWQSARRLPTCPTFRCRRKSRRGGEGRGCRSLVFRAAAPSRFPADAGGNVDAQGALLFDQARAGTFHAAERERTAGAIAFRTGAENGHADRNDAATERLCR